MEIFEPQAKRVTLAQKKMIAFHRFGLGAKPGAFKKMGDDPLKALLAELDKRGIASIPRGTLLPTYAQACNAGETNNVVSQTYFRREIDARFDKHMKAPIGFVERLVIFWSNHFSMHASKEVSTVVRATQGQLERDVIRKYVLGSFPSMLVGVMTHPAMIAYLDNHASVGPNSEAAKNSSDQQSFGKGTNVNLAREIMELHTVGSGGGYTEADINQLALIISGWGYATLSEANYGSHGATPQTVGQFLFKPKRNEPGSRFHMGTTYPNEGALTGRKVLRKLALRRATAEHLAYKLILHFITDKPTPRMVDKVADAYMKSRGNLKATAKALLRLPQAWKMPLRKFRTPYETVTAQYRALGRRHGSYAVDGNGSDTSGYPTTKHNLEFLHHQTWECLDPDGWDDSSAEWLNPDGIRVRLAAWNEAVKKFAPSTLNTKDKVVALGRSLLGRNLSAPTVAAIRAAPDPKKALTVLFVSPEFQRR